jgi:repressor LexA
MTASLLTDDDVYTFILTFQRQHGYPPTQKEIAAGVGRSKGTVNWHIRQLLGKGFVKKVRPGDRGICILGMKGDLSWQQ